MGDLPVPPTERLPTLMTGRSNVITPLPRSKARERRPSSSAYIAAKSGPNGASNGGSGLLKEVRPSRDDGVVD